MPKEFQSSRPIYMQIVDQIIINILQGKQRRNAKLLSVREMAIEMGVNPNTLQRAYGELERMGVVETKRGQGTFVVDNPNLFEQLRCNMQAEIVGQYVEEMKKLGVSNSEMINLVKSFLEGDAYDH
ncbi:DNA-binding transcriptional regulator YhcF, GntR family [Amphibacillus marinus]|uniref:DNA-binding transcriptional regulator YhcF, GntR family n=1 Tax=Amphibacillus marinus TaxID=872970 RepID=A0A1H8K697_9BACI|nr:GntR family transcriptional regulator [Amphibacillus marinus]SEN88227.1 DNA-binding transcriptional regulator YhcF, GntR family [Amphibacillus marinus]